MAWNKLLQLISGGALVLAQALPQTTARLNSVQAPAKLDEILSHECAQSVSSLLSPGDQHGPVFYDGGLIFTSIETSNFLPLLIVSTGNGIFAVNLEGVGTNRIRFTLPTKNGNRTYFLSYLHGTQTRSRVFDFSIDQPPRGKEEFDFNNVRALRNEALLAHLEYAIYQTAESTLANLTEGRVHRDQFRHARAESCEHIVRKSPQLARNIKRNLDVIEMIVLGPEPKGHKPTRMPASIAARKLVPFTSVDK